MCSQAKYEKKIYNTHMSPEHSDKGHKYKQILF